MVAGLQSFFEAVIDGKDLQREVPFDRWNVESGYHPTTSPKGMSIYARFGAFCAGEHMCKDNNVC